MLLSQVYFCAFKSRRKEKIFDKLVFYLIFCTFEPKLKWRDLFYAVEISHDYSGSRSRHLVSLKQSAMIVVQKNLCIWHFRINLS
ncbi:MAG TPA: hypothetical protein DEG09_08175 [Marinilabiliaceae bacterium]|nr:hypothetical protein [Marinilabiliaceae bacterium]